MSSMTRRERRALRQRRFQMSKHALVSCVDSEAGSGTSVTDRDARLATRLAHLDYKVSGETGAMRVPSKARTWHLEGRLNAHRPPPGRGWERSGVTYVTGINEVGFAKPIIHHRWRRTVTEAPRNTTK